MSKRYSIQHHSVADWDITHGTTYSTLSNADYISEPTSLRTQSPDGVVYDIVVCRIGTTLNLPEGEVRTWMRNVGRSYQPAVFRNQSPLGSAIRDNTYILRYIISTISLIRGVAGGWLTIDSSSAPSISADWNHFRVHWYNGKNPAEQEALCVDTYVEVAGEWQKRGDTLYDTSNMWKDSSINRTGIQPTSGRALDPMYTDDTEICGPP
ncbi:hypothetical protein ES708_17914 [subsurface metagenome]